MAYDEELADRIRALLDDRDGLTEKKMFGGLGFMIGGNMAIAASGQGGILVRVDPEESDELVATTFVLSDGAMLTSESTLRFRERDEVEADLAAHGYELIEVRDAPDRPGREHVFFARKP